MSDIDHIPSELLHDILRQVPAESLLRWRSVCKSWRQLIDDADFINSHIKYQSSSLSNLHIKAVNNVGTHVSISLDFLNFSNYGNHKIVDKSVMKYLSCYGVHDSYNRRGVAYCNGLFLLDDRDYGMPNMSWILWNPLTRDFYKLPPCDHVRVNSNHFLYSCGLGYDSITNDYKVVIIHDKITTTGKTSIFSLKSKSWKSIMDCPSELDNKIGVGFNGIGVYLDGTLYWLLSDFIIALDLSTEDSRQLPLPTYDQDVEYLDMDVAGGFLVLTCKRYYGSQRINAWVMKDDGGNISWTRLFSLSGSDPICACLDTNLVTYSESNRHALFHCHHEQCFYWVDIDTKRAAKTQIYGLDRNFMSQVWSPSLIRLDNNVVADRTSLELEAR